MTEEKIKDRIAVLSDKHKHLKSQIKSGYHDTSTVTRLKLKKLAVKDSISVLEKKLRSRQ
jgi:hypothetical protein